MRRKAVWRRGEAIFLLEKSIDEFGKRPEGVNREKKVKLIWSNNNQMTVSCPSAVMNSLITFYCELVHFCDALVVLFKRSSYKKLSYIVKSRDSLNLSNGNHLICHMTIKVDKK